MNSSQFPELSQVGLIRFVCLTLIVLVLILPYVEIVASSIAFTNALDKTVVSELCAERSSDYKHFVVLSYLKATGKLVVDCVYTNSQNNVRMELGRDRFDLWNVQNVKRIGKTLHWPVVF